MLLSGKLEEISNSSHLENSLSIPFKFSREDYLEKKKKNDRKNSLDYEIELRDHFKFSPALFVPFLLKHSLRKYQEVGLQWMVSCYENSMNGILADEMGLGKTIQTISLLAYLACKHGSWGPHLIIVPTSVMLNWEVEFKKWCPAFKILTYFGSQKERKLKRRGWSKSNNFHICITTYRLVVQDQIIFRRKKWGYMILDEAHLIKNWRSQRWQTLLHFNSNRRLLLTGTPLQNNLMELWSLMHFLMPNLFQSHAEFKSWFSNPLMEMVDEGDLIDQSVISRLHDVLRPFILRRLKKDVEKNLPEKKEHIISCQLSRRQRRLYEEYISSSDTTTILDSGNLLGVINCLMQLRKVCNHPDLFAGRTIISSFDLLSCLTLRVPLLICSFIKIYCKRKEYLCTFGHFEYFYTEQHSHVYKFENSKSIHLKSAAGKILKILNMSIFAQSMIEKFVNSDNYRNKSPVKARTSNGTLLSHVIKESQLSISSEILHIKSYYHAKAASVNSSSIMQRIHWVEGNLYTFYCVIPRVRATTPKIITGTRIFSDFELSEYLSDNLSHLMESFRYITVRQQLFFHDRKLLQYDCGKLQKLAHLLRALRVGGHKVLIFTQMTKMLDILESFLNLYGYTYCRLDGNTKPEQRQLLVQRFNTDKKLFAFILSTRSGGFGINLTGADTVIFYDTDWNPAIDSQAQDRCHRIGQKKEVHIYRLICDGTVEENIMKKAMRKRELDRVAIQSALFHSFNCNKSEFFFFSFFFNFFRKRRFKQRFPVWFIR
jgi:SNF2 family DNA or RNA helicase